MYDLEKTAKEWEDNIEFVKKCIEEDKNFPFKTPYTLAKAVGSRMSFNFEIKNRDRAQGFISYMMYGDKNNNKKELEDLLGIEIYQLNLNPYDPLPDNVEDIFKRKVHDFCKYCIETGLYDPNESYITNH